LRHGAAAAAAAAADVDDDVFAVMDAMHLKWNHRLTDSGGGSGFQLNGLLAC